MSKTQIPSEITETIRNSNNAFALGIRRCLEGKGIELSTSIIADLFPDDYCFDFGLVVTNKNEVFQFGYSYPPNQEEKGEITEWNNLTEKWKNTPYAEQIKAAHMLLQKNT